MIQDKTGNINYTKNQLKEFSYLDGNEFNQAFEFLLGKNDLPMEFISTYNNTYKIIKDEKYHRINIPKWKEDTEEGFNAYCDMAFKEVTELMKNREWIQQLQSYYPKVNILKSIEKMYNQFWGQEEGWKNKKQKRTNDVDWKRTIENGFKYEMNRVYK